MNPPIQPTAEAAAQKVMDTLDWSDPSLVTEADLQVLTNAIEELICSREALASYSASQEVLRGVERLPDCCEHGTSECIGELVRNRAIEAARNACEKFPKP